MNEGKRKRITIIFAVVLGLIVMLFIICAVHTSSFNKKVHRDIFEGDRLFGTEEDRSSAVSVNAQARSSTWTKVFDPEGEGLVDPNYQAFTYDYHITDNTRYEVSDYKFTIDFGREVYLMSAWNGSLEITQVRDGEEYTALIPDLREFDPAGFNFDTLTIDGEPLVKMQAGDKLVYIPSSSVNALETPIKGHEGVTPGFILYVPIGEDISGSTVTIDYTLHTTIVSEPLFKVAVAACVLWVVSLIAFMVAEMQVKKYEVMHEHDIELIKESIETFTGFIDAKDPYTNGHSKRVAEYTRMIAQEMGYSGEELDMIYYVALLHDCGKIGVPDNILSKPGKLTDEEFDIIKSHTTRGGRILVHFKSLEHAEEGALYHHERYDGRGYPKGKKGEDIPLIARMICVADSFDAMNSNRVYRKKLTKEKILSELEENKGTQFDPKIAEIFIELIKNGKIDMSD